MKKRCLMKSMNGVFPYLIFMLFMLVGATGLYAQPSAAVVQTKGQSTAVSSFGFDANQFSFMDNAQASTVFKNAALDLRGQIPSIQDEEQVVGATIKMYYFKELYGLTGRGNYSVAEALDISVGALHRIADANANDNVEYNLRQIFNEAVEMVKL